MELSKLSWISASWRWCRKEPRWRGSTPLIKISLPGRRPAAMKVPASILSPMTLYLVPWSFSTPWISRIWEPMPWIFAPMETRKLQRSWTSGSQAAESMRVLPLVRTAAMSRLAVPVTVLPCLPPRKMSRP